MSKTWVHCPVCGHRMFFLQEGTFRIEIKCTSCKRIVKIQAGKEVVSHEVLETESR